ncbi:UDP-3-O-(3-hydroxymyristoyl)glucosamine N-acyltransferase [Sulfurivermis fontis]|uniref:UDP-3-O-(3-hydroxymyristoyl)glucosamine N-acyltransferase n=1 Tax=Sulfurivermis fontis TaxID=1972068 RepID=UPI000FDAC177|nr:UDP-3-O-(3-hydroxymyristoyl)glucosamine N-acyltransferase [Sulfurivermis fontis]
MSITLAELAQRLGARLVGDGQRIIDGVATLVGATAGTVTFLTNPRYRKHLQATQATAVILREDDLEFCPTNALVVANPHVAYARTAALFVPALDAIPGIHPTAVVAGSARIDASASIGPHCVVGADCTIGSGAVIGPGCVLEHGVSIGAGTRLVANVTVYYGCRIGDRCLIHAGAVIGSDGFGFANDRGSWVKVPQLGAVEIGDDVEIGANTTIDRGAIENTVLEHGVKLDNQIQVAHNVRIGANTIMAACVGVAGSTVIGKNCTFAGGVGVVGHLEIADGVTVTGMSMVTKSLKEPGVYSSGTPLESSELWHKNAVRFRQLDDMARRLKHLEKELQELKKG